VDADPVTKNMAPQADDAVESRIGDPETTRGGRPLPELSPHAAVLQAVLRRTESGQALIARAVAVAEMADGMPESAGVRGADLGGTVRRLTAVVGASASRLAPHVSARPIELGEAALAVLAIGAASIAMANQWGLLGLHPLWLVAVGIGLRYGAPSGHFAAGIAAIAYLVILWVQPEDHSRLLSSQGLVPPLIMLAAGVAVTELTSARRTKQARLESALSSAALEARGATERFSSAMLVNRELEDRILRQTRSVVTLSAVGRRLQTLHIPDLYEAIVQVAAKCLGAQTCSLYLLSEGKLQLVAVYPQSPARLQAIQPVTGLPALAIERGRVVTVRERSMEWSKPSFDAEPTLMAGPLNKSVGVVAGVVAIERIPFLRLTPTAVQEFEAILDWASLAYQNALLFDVLIEWSSVAYQGARLLQGGTPKRHSEGRPVRVAGGAAAGPDLHDKVEQHQLWSWSE